jgi:hypothetical protein
MVKELFLQKAIATQKNKMKHFITLFSFAIMVFALFPSGVNIGNSSKQSCNKASVKGNSCSISNDTVAPKILFLKNGINYIDLNGDNNNDMVISGFRNNITAHVFSYYTFYIYDKDFERNNTRLWSIVEIKNDKNGDDNTSRYDICTSEGADGTLSDIAFIKDINGKYQLLQADREFGESFADPGIVTFSYYWLNYDSTENRYIYQVKSRNFTKRKYVDVKDAIVQEIK